jgi:DNA-directed RNA polymerase subunit M/transcription elongation factor TFIIS
MFSYKMDIDIAYVSYRLSEEIPNLDPLQITNLARILVEELESITEGHGLSEQHHVYNMQLTRLNEIISLFQTGAVDPSEFSSIKSLKDFERHRYLSMVKDEKETKRSNCTKKCPACQAQNTYRTDVQLRSADEAQTSIFECIECGHEWQR